MNRSDKKLLLQMADGGIVGVRSDRESYGGCETCDWGSSYINEFAIEMTSGAIEIKTDKMYEYALSEGYMMEMILHNYDEIRAMTESGFREWLEGKMRADLGGVLSRFEFVSA